MVIDDIVKQYQILSSSDRDLLIEVRNKLTYLNTHVDILIKQIALLESVATESLRFLDEIDEVLNKFKEFENVQRK